MSLSTETLVHTAGAAASLFLSALASAHAVMYKRDPKGATIWIFVCFTLPVLGPWLYWAIGINRIERRAEKRFGRRERPFDDSILPDDRPSADLPHRAVGHLESLRTVADRVTRLPMIAGNTLHPLHNGEQAYPRMLEAIAGARTSVTLASYIFDWDDVGREFARTLADAAERGARVHVLLDGMGAHGGLSRKARFLRKAGVEVAAFFPLRFPWGRVRWNLRNHRKILVVDGRTGFTGGMNISERYLVSGSRRKRCEDLHFEVTGPVVAEMQHAFKEDWALATNEELEGEAYFPELKPTGPALCRGISSGPDENFEIIHWILQAALASAQSSVRIVTPYFVPSLSLISAMAMAALRGVRISLLLPSFVDQPYMRWAADAYLWQVIERGIKVFRRPPPFVHTKLMIVDERWVLLGSANLDRRSFRLNFEFNVEAYDIELARDLSAWLDELLDQSEQVTLEQMDARPAWRRLRDGLVKLFSPYL
jgi:cardiolipin synthase